MGSPKSGTKGALQARCSKLWGMFHVPSGMHTVLLLSTLAWLCYLGAWLLLDFSLGNHLQVSPMHMCTLLCTSRLHNAHLLATSSTSSHHTCESAMLARVLDGSVLGCPRTEVSEPVSCYRQATTMSLQIGIITMLAEETPQTLLPGAV